MIEHINNFIFHSTPDLSFDSEQVSIFDQSPLSQSTGAGAGGHFNFDMHPSAPASPSPRSTNEVHLADDETAEDLMADEVAIIFSFLPHQDIMRARVCSKTWRDAAEKTLVPLCEFRVDSVISHNAMRAMRTALPNLQQLSIAKLGIGHRDRHIYSAGEDPDERSARHTADCSVHDINIISNFTKLRVLHIDEAAPLNGSYPVLFSFPLLEKLIIKNCPYLKWDLEMLQGLPSLKELDCRGNGFRLTGSLSSLGALKDSLEKVRIHGCRKISGNFIDLADLPRLKKLDLRWDTEVTGDIRDICEDDFPALERLDLPRTVHGGMEYKFQSISEVPSFMQAVHLLMQRTPKLFEKDRLARAFGWSLSQQSPDWYDSRRGSPQPPFSLQIIQAGSRRGWSWCVRASGAQEARSLCQINWLDPEPSSDYGDYAAYIAELEHIEQRIGFYRGYHEPPTGEEYRRLCGVPASIPGLFMV
eukprot:scaffold33624_cov191-Skeletonema_dohrnii-CCMP3373.AAC.4